MTSMKSLKVESGVENSVSELDMMTFRADDGEKRLMFDEGK